MRKLTEHQQTNQAYWDDLVDLHMAQKTGSDRYRVREFLAGDCILDPLVRDEIGDVAGKSLLHLQCHFGLDTLSLARLGAFVTGIDFSPKGVATARKLSADSGVPGRFIEGRVEDVADLIQEQFDMVFTSWGAIMWLGNLGAWAATIGHALKPGGVFYMAEGHPLVMAPDSDRVHVPPVTLGLGVDLGVAVALRGRGQQEARTLLPGQAQGLVGAEGPHLEDLDRKTLEVGRARRRGEMKDPIQIARDVDEIRDVVFHEREAVETEEILDVLEASRQEVVHADNLDPLG